MNRLEQIEKQTGRMYTLADAQAAAERATHAPTSLTDTDIALLEYFNGSIAAKEAEQRRRSPIDSPVPPSPLAPVPSVQWLERELGPVFDFIWQMNDRNKERNEKIAKLEANERAYAVRLELLESQIRALEERDAVGVQR